MIYTLSAPMRRAFYGLEPDRLDGRRIHIRPGHCAAAYPNSGLVLMDFPDAGSGHAGTVDLDTVGPWGADAALPSDCDLYLYAIASDQGETAFIASASNGYSGVTYPDGWDLYGPQQFGTRKHPIALKLMGGAVPPFHLGSGTGRRVLWTDAGNYLALHDGDSGGAWSSLSLSYWVPDSARVVTLLVETSYPSGSAGSCYLRSPGWPASQLVGSALSNSAHDVVDLTIRVNSTREIDWLTTGNAKLTLRVVDYEMTEPV